MPDESVYACRCGKPVADPWPDCWDCIIFHCCSKKKVALDAGLYKGKKCTKHGIDLKKL